MARDTFCYIRRSGKPWELGKDHHERALESYLSLEGEPGSDECITVPHVSGGTLSPTFPKSMTPCLDIEMNMEISCVL